MNNNLKIFLAYHKNTPIYKSEVFQPLYVGAEIGKEKIDFTIPDNTGDNISSLNPYYCELTGHYWVLKNYLNSCKEDYIGFGHYRRLPDVTAISDKDYPSIYGCSYSESLKIFEKMKEEDLTKYCAPYDIILPCSVYLYANTVNPLIRDNEPHYNMYEQFKIEHDSELLDIVKNVVGHYFPDYTEALNTVFKKEKIHCFNMYIMKKDILQSFLEWEFALLYKTGMVLGGWEQEKYSRMAGFLGERLINIWLEKNNSFKVGYFPTFMIDFDSDYIAEANRLHSQGDYKKEIEVLNDYLPNATNKFKVYLSVIQLYELLNQREEITKSLSKADSYAVTAEDYFSLAQTVGKYKENKDSVIKFYETAIKQKPDEKFYAQSFLLYANALKDISVIDEAWKFMLDFDLTPDEKEKYNHFIKIKSMINGQK